MPVGKSVESAGTFVNLALDLSEGKSNKAIGNMTSKILYGQIGKKVKTLENAGKLSRNETTLLEVITDVYERITTLFINHDTKK